MLQWFTQPAVAQVVTAGGLPVSVNEVYATAESLTDKAVDAEHTYIRNAYTSTIHLVALECKRPCAESDAATPTKKYTPSALCRVDQTVPCHCKLTHMV